ncbi:hypothetical protein D3C83_153810 [compost metagenome]
MNSWSLATPNEKRRVGPRREFKVSSTGINAGGGPSRPAIAVARSCDTVPTTAPRLASFAEVTIDGSTVMTSARVIGNAVGPRL